jgi:hypothetical protein
MRTCKVALVWAVLFGVAVPAGADVVTEWNTVALTSIRHRRVRVQELPPTEDQSIAIQGGWQAMTVLRRAGAFGDLFLRTRIATVVVLLCNASPSRAV